MSSAPKVVAWICLFSILVHIAFGTTFSNLGIQFSASCRGFASLNNTNGCNPCSKLCRSYLEQGNKLDPKSHGVEIDASDTQCSQIKIETNQILCFDNLILNDDKLTIVDYGHVLSVQSLLYLGAHDSTTVKFFPAVEAGVPFPDFVHPRWPFTTMDTLYTYSVVFNHGLLICLKTLTACFHWSFHSGTSSETDIWTPMPVPLQYHDAGAMGLLNGRPIVVGGKTKFGTSQESVEIFDPVTFAWTAKPNLLPARSHHTLVQVDPGTVIVIGGWTRPQSQVVGYTDMLSSGDSQWTKLPDRPEVAYGCACGMVQLADGRNGILSIGGKGKFSLLSTAYFLDLASTTWTPVAEYNVPYPFYFGLLFQVDTKIYFIPKGKSATNEKQFVKDVYQANQPWELRPSPKKGLGEGSYLPIIELRIFNMTTN